MPGLQIVALVPGLTRHQGKKGSATFRHVRFSINGLEDHFAFHLSLLQNEQSSHSLLLALEDLRFLLKPPFPARFLVQELVVVVARAAGYFPRPRDLEPLDRRLVGLDFWHLSSCLRLRSA